MSRPLIINARHRLAWHQRLFSDASTAMMWGGWLWLWSPILRSTALADLTARTYPTLLKVFAGGSLENVQHSLIAIAGTSGTLMVWNRLPGRKAQAAPPVSTREYARHFELTERQLDTARASSVCVVHHDDDGRIVRVECREPEGCAQALSA